jgi:four helix bundle protein
MNKKELEKRLVDFVVVVTKLITEHNKNLTILHLNDQAIRSSTSCALNYGEAQSAVSKRDFIHKISIVLKELRETYINLTIIKRLNEGIDLVEFDAILKENDELLAIFHKTMQTARKNG